MALSWYFYGDIDCYFRGGTSGTVTDLADALAASGNAQGIVDTIGSSTTPPGLADSVAGLIATAGDRWPGIPVWTAADWPLDWQVKVYPSSQSGVDRLVMQPGAVAFQWPPEGGGSLNVNLTPSIEPDVADPDTVRYGDALMQAVDQMVVTPAGRARVTRAAGGGPVETVDALAILKQIDPDLGKTKAPPASFTVALDSTLTTVDTRLEVNANGGVHLQVGWIAVSGGRSEEDAEAEDVGPVMMREYPCGSFN
ncbi:hypothetical protein [Rubrivirga marina]|uniref:Uncharacterized protein n=1 Tax=Rubrivirga marina TaxID=1196024 RepID=A0A271J0C0_9BACT|nr:hypothetical protein [Rubrivirga marina]PAP76405.1 hypothetical protein BSZ37_08080 [Rubrivirga marina]